MMVRITSPEHGKIVLLGIGLLLVVAATAFGQIRLNAWNRPFYDALQRKDLHGFLVQLQVFCIIAGFLLMLNVAQTWLNQATKVKLREGLVGDLFGQWLKPRRAFRLAFAGEIGSNPDQRIHEDARHLTELSTDLGIGLLQSSLLLGSFIEVLWMLSGNVVFHVSGQSFAIPGYMVWCALIYSGTASWISWLIGRPLAQLYAARYAQEAELRFALHRPRLIVIDEALDALDDDTRTRVLTVFNEELDNPGIINIGRPDESGQFFTRVLHLVKDPQGRCFLPNFRTV